MPYIDEYMYEKGAQLFFYLCSYSNIHTAVSSSAATHNNMAIQVHIIAKYTATT